MAGPSGVVPGSILYLWSKPPASPIPVSPYLCGGLPAAQTECQACGQGDCTDRCHEQGIDELPRDANLIDRHDNGERPDRYARDIGQELGVANVSLCCYATNESRQSIGGDTPDDEDSHRDNKVRQPEEKLPQ